MTAVQLVFTSDVLPVRSAFFGQGSGDVLLDDLTCTGNEQTLLDCTNRSNRPLLSSDCDHSEDAGVKCQGMYLLYVHGFRNRTLTI